MKRNTKIAVLLLLLGVVICVFLSWQVYVRCLDIFEASERGYLDRVSSIIDKNLGLVNTKRPEDEYTPLMLAALNGHEDVAKFLIDKGADVNALSLNQHTPLTFAAIYGHMNICKLLVDKGADINAKDRNGSTPLTVAVGYAYDYGDTKIMEFLIDKGGDVKTKNAMDDSLIHGSGWSKRPEIAELLITRYGLEINAKNYNLRTPLWQASFTGNEEAVKILIALGADISARDKMGETCLHAAAQMGHSEVIDILINNGAEVNVKNNNGESSLDIAIKKGHAKVAKILRKYGDKSEK